MKAKSSSGDLVLVHWHADEAEELAEPLRSGGWRVTTGGFELPALKPSPPVAVVISLRRLPSHGREVAGALRFTRWGREIPVVFLDGEPEKVAVTRASFPAAHFATWSELPDVLQQLHAVSAVA